MSTTITNPMATNISTPSSTRLRCPIPVEIMRDPLTLRSIAKELAAKTNRANASAETQELADAIVKTLKDPSSPRTKKASLVTAYYLASSSDSAAARLAESGSVPLLLEMLVDSDRSTCEKALGVLDAVVGSGRGREEACGHALAVPVVMKKMFRVSETATRFAVSAMWRMVKGCEDEERRAGLAGEAMGAGAFQKLLLLLQVGCGEGTKEKASELLRMLNQCRGAGGECVESADFRGIKRNF